jgi:type VI secretion system secreted protein VgrG
MKLHSIPIERPDAGRLPEAEYVFSCEASPLLWQVRRFELHEALSEPYRLELDLVTEVREADDLAIERLLGAGCELWIEREVTQRVVCGVITRIELRPRVADRLALHVVVEPALALLDQRVDTRVWQGLAVPTIVEEVLAAGLADHGRNIDRSHLQASYDEREYVVQFRESDLAFAARLLEDEGIAYWFDHERGSGKEVLVLEDRGDGWPEIATLDGDPTLALIVEREQQAEVESIQRLDRRRALTSTSVVRRTFDWRDPQAELHERAPPEGESPADERGLVREVYEHGRRVERDPARRAASELARVREPDRRAWGQSNATGLAPGRRFRMSDPEREYLVIRVTHRGDCPEVELGPADARPSYVNEFECVEFDGAPWRPPHRARRPRIYGPQTAIVTGPEREEIHTDEHGRIKVRFPWDRVHALTDDTSMWIRVAQGWAGAGFGVLFTPRVGMEVVVEFIDGDPDQPLVTGCVYNGDSRSSVALPGEKTRSTIRTRSSPGGGGFNELRFEDAAGSEELFVHAQRDLRETVRHDHAIDVGHDEHLAIGANQTRTVGKDRTTTIRGNETVKVEGTRSEHVHGSDSLTVDGPTKARHHDTHEQWITGSATRHVIAGAGPASSTLRVEGRHALIVDDLVTATVGKGFVITQGGGRATCSIREDVIEQYAAKDWTSHADAHAQLDAGDRVTIAAANKVELGQGGAAITLENDAVIVQANEIRLVVGETVLVLDAAGLHLQGAAVDVGATGTCTITAATISMD